MLFALRLWLGKHIYGVIGNSKLAAGYRISFKRVVKWPCEEPELDGRLFALANTHLPAPQIYSARTWWGHHAITMEYIAHYKTVEECWHTLSSDEEQKIVLQVSEYIQQLRSLSPPKELNGRVSATNGGPCRDIRISCSKLFGPFDEVASFHRCLRGGVESDGVHEIFGEKVANIHNRQYTVRFTLGDLGPQNTLVRGSNVVAIIDWECSGWYPEYWEYTKAHYNSALLPEFYEMLRRHIPQYDEELAAERTLWRNFDQPLDEAIEMTTSSESHVSDVQAFGRPRLIQLVIGDIAGVTCIEGTWFQGKLRRPEASLSTDHSSQTYCAIATSKSQQCSVSKLHWFLILVIVRRLSPRASSHQSSASPARQM